MSTYTTTTRHTIEITHPGDGTYARVATHDGRVIADGRWSRRLLGSDIGIDKVLEWLANGAHCGGPSVCGWASVCDPETSSDCYEPEPPAPTEAAPWWRGYDD